MKKIALLSILLCATFAANADCADASYQCFSQKGELLGSTTLLPMWDGGWQVLFLCMPKHGQSVVQACEYVAQVCNDMYPRCLGNCKPGGGSTWTAITCTKVPIGN